MLKGTGYYKFFNQISAHPCVSSEYNDSIFSEILYFLTISSKDLESTKNNQLFELKIQQTF